MKTQFWKKLGSLILDKNDDPDEKRIIGWIFAGITIYYFLHQIGAALPVDLATAGLLLVAVGGCFGLSLVGDKQPNNTPPNPHPTQGVPQ